MAERFLAVVDGGRLRVASHGDGDIPVVLLHGAQAGPTTSRGWPASSTTPARSTASTSEAPATPAVSRRGPWGGSSPTWMICDRLSVKTGGA